MAASGGRAVSAEPAVIPGDAAIVGRLLCWNGRCLTIEGEDHFAIYVWTHEALAAALLRLATESNEVTDEEVTATARVTEILAGRDLRTPFVLGAAAVAGMLLHLRLGRLERS